MLLAIGPPGPSRTGLLRPVRCCVRVSSDPHRLRTSWSPEPNRAKPAVHRITGAGTDRYGLPYTVILLVNPYKPAVRRRTLPLDV